MSRNTASPTYGAHFRARDIPKCLTRTYMQSRPSSNHHALQGLFTRSTYTYGILTRMPRALLCRTTILARSTPSSALARPWALRSSSGSSRSSLALWLGKDTASPYPLLAHRVLTPHLLHLSNAGLTEVAGGVTYLHKDRKVNKLGSVGCVIPGVHVRIVKPDGTLAQRGELGEICAKGPSLALGYLNNPAACVSPLLLSLLSQ